jgi:hypothetical protein
MMTYRLSASLVFMLLVNVSLWAEDIRVHVVNQAELSSSEPAGMTISFSYQEAALIRLDADTRFFRGVELEITAPAEFLRHQGSLAIAIYAELEGAETLVLPFEADLRGRRVFYEPLPNKIRPVYQIPLREAHGLRTTPYVSVLPDVVLPASFPLLFRIVPLLQNPGEELESMRFQLTVRPLLSEEGAVALRVRYPELLPDRPFTVLIDDEVIEQVRELRLLREGEHSLIVLSDDYRNESRRFFVERGKTLELIVALRDLTPFLEFEAPEQAHIFVDGTPVADRIAPYPLEPGVHEVKIQLSDYTIIRNLTIKKGKTYRVTCSVEVTVSELD